MIDTLSTIIRASGPLTGKELIAQSKTGLLATWRICSASRKMKTIIIGQRYLRLDQKVEGLARLSPSIMREFLNYTVIGLSNSNNDLVNRAEQLENEIAVISARKKELAITVVKRLVNNRTLYQDYLDSFCFIIAGDVVYNMAHREARPESSTGELVSGSDLDLIIVTNNLPKAVQEQLDSDIYHEKHILIANPALKEELDYIIKDLSLVENQLQFNDFKAMVASKILNEGMFIAGSYALFERLKTMVAASKVPEKLAILEEKAKRERREAEQILLSASGSETDDWLMALFYTTEEKEEIF